jgi:hypothetical protein
MREKTMPNGKAGAGMTNLRAMGPLRVAKTINALDLVSPVSAVSSVVQSSLGMPVHTHTCLAHVH